MGLAIKKTLFFILLQKVKHKQMILLGVHEYEKREKSTIIVNVKPKYKFVS